MSKFIQKSIVFLIFLVPLIFSHATTEVYGLIKVVVLEIGVLTLFILWLIQFINSPQTEKLDIFRKRIFSALDWVVLCFLCVALLSLTKAINIHEGIQSIYQLAAGIGLFFLVVKCVKEKKELNEILFVMVLGGILASLFSLYENRGIKFTSLRFAYTSTFGNPIFFAEYLTLAIPISLSMCFQKDTPAHKLSRVFFGLSVLFMLFFLFLTRSRGAYLGLGVALLYYYIAVLLNSSKKIRNLLIGLVAFFLIASVFGFLFSTEFKTKVGENIKLRNLMRVYVWSSTFEMVKDHPVLGVGIGNFGIRYPLYRSSEEKEITPKGVKYTKAHNDYLQIWAEMGTLGLVCFLWIMVSLMSCVRYSLQKRAGPSNHIFLGVSASMIALLVQALFNPLLSVPASGMGFWVLMGLLALEGRCYYNQIPITKSQ